MVPSSGKTALTGSIVITTHTEPNKAEYFSPSTANSTTSNINNNNNNASSTSNTTTTVIVAPSVHLLQKDTDDMRDAEEEQEKLTGESTDPGVEGIRKTVTIHLSNLSPLSLYDVFNPFRCIAMFRY